jgi:hypothetical protein
LFLLSPRESGKEPLCRLHGIFPTNSIIYLFGVYILIFNVDLPRNGAVVFLLLVVYWRCGFGTWASDGGAYVLFCCCFLFLNSPFFSPTKRERERQAPWHPQNMHDNHTGMYVRGYIPLELELWIYDEYFLLPGGGGNVCVSLDCKSLSLARSLSLLFTQ